MNVSFSLIRRINCNIITFYFINPCIYFLFFYGEPPSPTMDTLNTLGRTLITSIRDYVSDARRFPVRSAHGQHRREPTHLHQTKRTLFELTTNSLRTIYELSTNSQRLLFLHEQCFTHSTLNTLSKSNRPSSITIRLTDCL